MNCKRDEEDGWLPDEEYSVSQAIILSAILLSLAILVGSVPWL
mgnify:CR=1